VYPPRWWRFWAALVYYMMYSFPLVTGLNRYWHVVAHRIIAFFLLWGMVAPAFAQGSETGTTKPPKTWMEQQQEAASTFYQLDQSNNYTESMTYADMNVLPMGIKRTAMNVEVTIAVSDVVWHTTHTELTLFARVKLPENGGQTLFFGAQGIKFSYNGDIIGDALLVLFGDVKIPIQDGTASLTLKGSFDNSTGRAPEGARSLTYVSVDCKGFKEMGITADVEFSENLMSPIDSAGHASSKGRVSGRFSTVVQNWNDLLVNINLPPFELKGLKGFVFTMQNAVFDFSDSRNDPAVVYPEGYQTNYMVPGNPTLWRGVFIQDLTVTLPEQFARRQAERRVSFEAHNMLLDNNGVSGLFGASGILPISDGQASGWRFSVDEFLLELEANRLKGATFSGLIGLPVAEKTAIGYDAIITASDEYQLRIKTLKKTKFDIFNAEAELSPNSYVAMAVVDGKFRPEAMLHGRINMAARLSSNPAGDTPSPEQSDTAILPTEATSATTDSTAKAIANFRGLEFRSLHLKTESPRFTCEYFGYKDQLKVIGFPVSIDRIGVRVQETEVALYLDLKLTLADNMFTGSTGFEFVGKYEEKTAPDAEGVPRVVESKWKYDKLRLKSIAIKTDIAEIFTITAQLQIMNNDPVYGDGYAGAVDLEFKEVLKGMKMRSRAMFGCKDFRYWFVDGRVDFPGGGLPVFGPVKLKGFGGGVYYRMKRDIYALASQTQGTYIPDEKTNFGVQSAVMFSVGDDAAINGEASFEIAFSTSGGVSFIGFYGFAKFVGTIPGTENIKKFVGDKFDKIAEKQLKYINDKGMLEKLNKLKQFEPNKASEEIFEPTQKPGQDGGLSAALGIQYDFAKKTLHATFDLYINAAGGIMRGAASGNRAGWAVLHVEPGEWYVHMGTPTDRLGVRMGVGSISVETGTYLMVGSRIPASPPPPKQVADILGEDVDKLDYMRDFNALGDGKGFAFGASLKVETGDITFLVLYANFAAGLGFDIMLKDYNDMQCVGHNGVLGMDGWYANGQAYAYLQGELGIKVNLWFLKTKIPIIKGAAAALMQAQLPNPAYVKGYLAVEFNLLGGAVSGKCRFKMEIGEKCELVVPGGSPIDMRMISDLTPKDKTQGVDVFAAPQAAFAMRMGTPFEIEDDNGPKTYRISLNDFSVFDEKTPVVGVLRWNANKDNVSFYSHEVLPPSKNLRAVVKVGFEEWVNGRWNVVYTSGQKAQEIMEATFTTGTAPDNIPVTNVAYAYPVMDQKFYLKDESNAGYIQLKRGQSYLFSADYRHEMQLTDVGGSVQPAAFTYSSAKNRIDYTVPTVSTQQAYNIAVVSLTKAATAAGQQNGTQTQTIGQDEDVITVSTGTSSSVIRNDIGKTLLGYSFATSRFTTFADKMKGNTPQRDLWVKVTSAIINLAYQINVAEPFDVAELAGTEYTEGAPLVTGEATLRDDYFQQDLNPLIYSRYGELGAGKLVDSTLLSYGVPPVRAITVLSSYLTQVEHGQYNGDAGAYLPFIYELPYIYASQYSEIQNRLLNKADAATKKKFEKVIIYGCPLLRAGDYGTKFQYTMPGGVKGTQAEFMYHNSID
jgi:hypothetical protein